MSSRSKARKRAIDILYESDARGIGARATLAERVELADPPVNEFTSGLIDGVAENLAQIDAVLGEYAEGWTVARMPGVDRAILRLGVYELLWRAEQVPAAVAIDEAVELAKTLSTDESPRFVNGVLARVLREVPAMSPDAATTFTAGDLSSADPDPADTAGDDPGPAR